MSNLDTFLEFVPASGRPLVKFGIFCIIVAGATLCGARWVNAQASERIERRVRPLEVQIIQLGAVAEATFAGLEDMRAAADRSYRRRDLKAIKRDALQAALKQAEEERKLEDGSIKLSTPGAE